MAGWIRSKFERDHKGNALVFQELSHALCSESRSLGKGCVTSRQLITLLNLGGASRSCFEGTEISNCSAWSQNSISLPGGLPFFSQSRYARTAMSA